MMTNRTFLTVHGVVYTVFAFALFFVPTIMWPMYGVQINDQYALFLSQHTSIFLGGIAAVSLMLRNVESGHTAKQLFKALLITNGRLHRDVRRKPRLGISRKCVLFLSRYIILTTY